MPQLPIYPPPASDGSPHTPSNPPALQGGEGQPGPSRRLGSLERRWTNGVLETLYPSNTSTGMPGADDVQLLEFHQDYLFRLPPLARIGLRLVIFLVAFTPLFFVGVPLPLHRLSPEKRQRHLSRWANSNIYWIREGVTLIKAATLMGYGGHPKVQSALGMRSTP